MIEAFACLCMLVIFVVRDRFKPSRKPPKTIVADKCDICKRTFKGQVIENYREENLIMCEDCLVLQRNKNYKPIDV